MENYCCAIIGQHPMRFPWGFDEEDTQCRRMKLELAQCIITYHFRHVLSYTIILLTN